MLWDAASAHGYNCVFGERICTGRADLKLFFSCSQDQMSCNREHFLPKGFDSVLLITIFPG